MYPLVAIDFEATSLDGNSVPIEVGVAIAATESAPVVVWATLIRPPADWDMNALWDPDAAKVHGITVHQLQQGMTPRAALEHLNKLINGVERVWCGDGKYDVLWFRRLCEVASPAKAVFELKPVSGLVEGCSDGLGISADALPSRQRFTAQDQTLNSSAMRFGERANLDGAWTTAND